MAGFLTGIGDVEHHQPAMTASSLQRFCRTFNTLLPLMVKTRLADCRHTKTTQRPQRAKYRPFADGSANATSRP
jgi:hypothetical protein